MEVGDLGVPTLPAARLVEEALRQNLDNATILPHHTEGPSVQALPIRQKNATLNRVQWMEVGDLGVLTLPAAGLVEEALRQNLDSATTLHPLMEELIA